MARNVIEVVVVSTFSLLGLKATRMCVGLNRSASKVIVGCKTRRRVLG